MPNVGPMLAWRIAIVAFLPMCRNAMPRPIVVVVFPSPSGVGVIAVTTTYFAFGRSGELVDGLQVDLGDVLAVGLGQPGRDTDVFGDFRDWLERSLTCDLERGGHGHGRGTSGRCDGFP